MKNEKYNISINKNPNNEDGLFTTKHFKKDDVLFYMEGKILDHPTKYTIQLSSQEHITDSLGKYLNHSCNPNTYINIDDKSVRASRDIKEGEELFFDYNENESEMATPFICKCGYIKCREEIRGSKFL